MKYLAIILLIATGCGSSYNLNRAKYHIARAEAKGAKWERDSVVRPIYIKLPADSGGAKAPQQAIDTSKVNKALQSYDSLKAIVKAKETTEQQLRKANAEIRKLKQRIGKGFAKDSVYQVQADSLTTLYFSYKSGSLDSAWYYRLPEKVDQDVTVGINNKIEATDCGLPWWVYAVFALCALVIIRLSFK